VTFTFDNPSRVVAPYSWVGHIPFVMWLVKEHAPKTIVELGVHTGNSFFAMCQAAKEANLNTLCHGVDTWEGDKHAGGYDESVWLEVSNYATQQYPRTASLHRQLFDQAVSGFKDGSIDLLHIDGLHTYEAVKHDYETWKPKLSDRGVVLFHDIAEHRDDFGVYKLWDELRADYPTVTFVHSHGLGVLFYGRDTVSLRELLAPAARANNLVPSSVDAFALAGSALAANYYAPLVSKKNEPFLSDTDRITIYVSSEAKPGYDEQHAVADTIPLGAHRHSVVLTVPGQPSEIRSLRLDPATRPCVFEFHKLYLADSAGNLAQDFLPFTKFSGLLDAVPFSDGNRTLLLCTGSDPQFELELSTLLVKTNDELVIHAEITAHSMFSLAGFSEIYAIAMNSIGSADLKLEESVRTISKSAALPFVRTAYAAVTAAIERSSPIYQLLRENAISVRSDPTQSTDRGG
jgi:hypothetical protein